MSTMREVAAVAGVSAKTVSRVINGDRYVSIAVRERVQHAIVDLDYVPNMLSQTFRAGRDSAIGVAVPDIADTFFGAVIQAVERSARERQTSVLVTSLGEDPAAERSVVESLLRRQLAGLIIAPISTDQSYLSLWQHRTELVFVDRAAAGISADSVVEDDSGGAAAAVRHLLDRGHRRIAFIGNADAVVTTGRRLEGYRTALSDAGIESDPALERLYHGGPDRAVPQLHAVLECPDPATAVFSSNSQSSIALVPELHDLGRTGVGFVSFGDFPMAAALRPSVTVLDQNPGLVGTTAADRLFARIDGDTTLLDRALVIGVPLILRSSSQSIVSGTIPAKTESGTVPAKRRRHRS